MYTREDYEFLDKIADLFARQEELDEFLSFRGNEHDIQFIPLSETELLELGLVFVQVWNWPVFFVVE